MIYLFLAEGFEEIEAITPIDILRRAQKEIKTVGVTGKVVNGTHGVPVTADITIDEVDLEAIDVVILPGGMPGTNNLKASKKLADIIMYAAQNNKLVTAICAAPSVLGGLGLLKGKKATCYPGFEEFLTGAELSKEICVKDGNFITANGPGSAAAFGYKILEAIDGNSTASESLQAGMLFKI